MDGFVSRLMDSEWMDRLLSKLMGGIVDCWMSRMVDEWIEVIICLFVICFC